MKSYEEQKYLPRNWPQEKQVYFRSCTLLMCNLPLFYAFCYLWDLQFFTWEYFCNILNQDQDPDMSCYRKVPLFLGVANKLHLWSLLFLNHLQMCIYRWQHLAGQAEIFAGNLLQLWKYKENNLPHKNHRKYKFIQNYSKQLHYKFAIPNFIQTCMSECMQDFILLQTINVQGRK